MKKAVIVGVGLMGGSLGMALCKAGGWRVTGVGRRAAALRRAKARRGVHDYSQNLKEAVKDADVVVLAAPVGSIVGLARQIAPRLKPGCLVMDVGSVKAPIARPLEKFYGGRGPWFVGCHPMAGSEKSGIDNARPDLYKGATCVVTPGRGAPPAVVARAEKFWRGLGARPFRMAPEAHDRWVALVSHLPHFLADSLVLTAGRQAGGNNGARLIQQLAAGSFRDMTRVAGADPALWSSIFRMNARWVRAAASAFSKEMTRLSRRGWRQSDLAAAKIWQEKFLRDKFTPL